MPATKAILVLAAFICFVTSKQGLSEQCASVVVLSSLERVLQHKTEINGFKKAEIFCVKGETESFQIIVANPANQDLEKIDLVASNWRCTGSDSEGVPVLRVFREHYVNVKQSSGRTNRKTVMYPDTLIPFIDPHTGKRIAETRKVITRKILEKAQD